MIQAMGIIFIYSNGKYYEGLSEQVTDMWILLIKEFFDRFTQANMFNIHCFVHLKKNHILNANFFACELMDLFTASK